MKKERIGEVLNLIQESIPLKNLTNVISVSSWKRNCNHTFNFVENLIDGVYYFKIVCSKCGYTNIYSIKQEDYLKWKGNNS